jgi:uncharacterized protein YqgC (DUF456 family)
VELLWWLIAIVLMAVGLIGTVLPIVPGTTIILAAAVIHRVMLGPLKSIGWWSIGVLLLLTLASYALDLASGYFGARRFGATKWGVAGMIAGGIIGLFFAFPGLLIGPVIGAIAGEIIGGKRLVKAGRAGWGTLLGSIAGMIGKLVIGLAMVSWFLVAAPSPF